MRRWKVIDGGVYYDVGDILTLQYNDESHMPLFYNRDKNKTSHYQTHRIVEIDGNGNTIRTYEQGDKLDEGTLIGGTMNKKDALDRLDAIEKEAKALREIIDKSDKIIYDDQKLYAFKNDQTGYTYILLGKQNAYAFYKITTSEFSYDTTVSSGQEAIDNVIKNGHTVHVFDDRKAVLKFMMECK